MADVISYSLVVKVGGEIKRTISTPIPNVNAYDIVEVKLPAKGDGDAVPQKVEVQPTDDRHNLKFMLIDPGTSTGELSYMFSDKKNDGGEYLGPVYVLDGPHVFLSPGAMEFCKDFSNSLYFTNTSAKEATISIIVGRNAAPKV